MIVGRTSTSSQMNGATSSACNVTNFRLHFVAIFRNVSHAISWTPGWTSCINSNSLFTTVLRNFQCALRKRGYCPTTYIMLLAITALLSLPVMFSVSPRRSLMTVTRNRFSSSSDMAPEMDPIAQHSVLRLFHDHLLPLTCSVSFTSMMFSVSSQLR